MHPVDKILRPALSRIAPYNSGLSVSDVKAKYNVSTIAKLSSNENPYGPAPEILANIASRANSVFLYPESEVRDLRTKLANYMNVEEHSLIFGNGSEELISIICRSVIDTGDRVITLFPSFPLHEDYALMMNGVVERIKVTNELKIDVEALIDAVRKPAKMLIFANPMNPVGAWMTPNELCEVIKEVHADTLIVLDEAYYEYAYSSDYCSGLKVLKPDAGNWVVLRTFSKAWGLAGLRIGFGICSSSALRSAFDITRTPFNINSVAQHSAQLAIQHNEHMTTHVSMINLSRLGVEKELDAIGLRYAKSLGNFLFIDVDHNASELSEKLLAMGTIVKPWKQEGFDTFIRVSIGTDLENRKFLKDLRGVLL
jgi:histidinol-phosphate aminotransferase